MKRLLTLIFILLSFNVFATTSNYKTFTSGSVLTAAELNSLQTNYTNGDNNILSGDDFSGNMNFVSGVDALFWSDSKSSLTAAIYGDSGKIYGCPQKPGTYGINFAYSSGTFTIECNGTTCSASNPGCVVLPSTTAGEYISSLVTASFVLYDDGYSGTSNLTNNGWSITETQHYLNDKPFYVYWANPNNGASDGTDGNPAPFIAALPTIKVTPSATQNIGDTGAIPTTDDQTSIIIMDDITNTSYDSVPAILVGAIRMTWSTTSDDWTITTLGNSDGVGRFNDNTTFTVPTSQLGAISGSHLDVSGTGTSVPTWASATSHYYTIKTNGLVSEYFTTTGSGTCTNGASVDQVTLQTAYQPAIAFSQSCGRYAASGVSTYTTGSPICVLSTSSNSMQILTYVNSGIGSNNFTSSSDDIDVYVTYEVQ